MIEYINSLLLLTMFGATCYAYYRLKNFFYLISIVMDSKILDQLTDLQSVSWSLAEFCHNKIVQSPHENYFNICRQHKDDNYSNWVIINYGVYKGLYHISCLLQIINSFIHPPQGLLFLVVKTF